MVQAPACTDNFQVAPFIFDGVEWHSCEQCYQAMKFVTAESRELIRRIAPWHNEADRAHGMRAWHEGQRLNDVRVDWNAAKVEVMLRVNRAKYAQHADLRRELLATGEAKIVGSPSTSWKLRDGTTVNWSSWNGLIQMRIRAELSLAAEESDKATVDGAHKTLRDLGELFKRYMASEGGLESPIPEPIPDGPTHVDDAAHSVTANPPQLEQTLGASEDGAAAGDNPCFGTPLPSSERVICVADVHGNLTQLKALWAALATHLGGEDELRRTRVVFLGDYCDRGPDTRGVLDWLIALKQERAHAGCAPAHFLLGNHDLGFAAFLGCLPIDDTQPSAEWLDATLNPSYTGGFWKHPVDGGMHYQGRRWGALRTYESAATFKSYGVVISYAMPPQMREDLLAVVPKAHRDFLQELQWVHEQAVAWAPGQLICVHAGLDEKQPVAAQLERLRARDLTAKVLRHEGDAGRLSALSGRRNVLTLPAELRGRALLVSGHHGFCDLSHGCSDRIVMDRGGGVPSRPLDAILLPERTVVSSDGSSY